MAPIEDRAVSAAGSRYAFKPQPYSSHTLLLAALPADGGGSRVLDVGCGPGDLASELARRGYRVTAIDRADIAPAALPGGAEYIAADLDFHFPDLTSGFAYVVCGDVLEHLRDPAALLARLRPLIGASGRLVASLPNAANLYVRLNVLLGRFPDDDRGLFDRTHLHFYSWRRWRRLLENSGYEIERVVPTGVPFDLALGGRGSWLGRALDWFAFQLARMRKQLFGYQFVVTACAAGFAHASEPAISSLIPAPDRAVSSAPAMPPRPLQTPKVVVVMPAYNAAVTLPATYADLPRDIVDHIILVDDGSRDETVRVARELGLAIFVHDRNYGYGANQKTCYREALKTGAEIVVMIHPDYQYDPTLLPEIIRPIREGAAGIVLGSRLLGSNPIAQGMPWWKYYSNRFLTRLENLVFRKNLSEYHTGYRAFHRGVLESVNFSMNSDGFIFDQEILAQAAELGTRIAEVPVPTRYFPQASSASLAQSTVYGLKILWLLTRYAAHRAGLRQRQFESLVRRYRSAPGMESPGAAE